jgi:hypothetical protein
MQRRLVEHVEVWTYRYDSAGHRYRGVVTCNLDTTEYRWAVWEEDEHGKPVSPLYEPQRRCTSLDETLIQIEEHIHTSSDTSPPG